MHKGSCYEECPDDTSLVSEECVDDVDSSCQDVENCESCSPTECSTCDDGHWLSEGSCLRYCPAYTYPSEDKKC